MIVRGYAVACGRSVDLACGEYRRATDRMLAARAEVDRLHAIIRRRPARDDGPGEPTRADLNAATDVLCAARVEASLAAQRANAAISHAERIATFAAQAMAGDVAPELLDAAAAAISELVGLRAEERAA